MRPLTIAEAQGTPKGAMVWLEQMGYPPCSRQVCGVNGYGMSLIAPDDEFAFPDFCPWETYGRIMLEQPYKFGWRLWDGYPPVEVWARTRWND